MLPLNELRKNASHYQVEKRQREEATRQKRLARIEANTNALIVKAEKAILRAVEWGDISINVEVGPWYALNIDNLGSPLHHIGTVTEGHYAGRQAAHTFYHDSEDVFDPAVIKAHFNLLGYPIYTEEEFYFDKEGNERLCLRLRIEFEI